MTTMSRNDSLSMLDALESASALDDAIGYDLEPSLGGGVEAPPASELEPSIGTDTLEADLDWTCGSCLKTGTDADRAFPAERLRPAKGPAKGILCYDCDEHSKLDPQMIALGLTARKYAKTVTACSNAKARRDHYIL